MSKKESEAIPFITPFGTLRYPKVSQPDTKGSYADGKFKTDILFSDDDFAVVEKTVKVAAAKLLLCRQDSNETGVGGRLLAPSI